MTSPPLLVVALLLLGAAPPDRLGPPPLRLLDTVSPQGEQQVGPGAIVSRAAIGRPDAVLLGDDIALDWKGEKRRFARGDILHAAGATGVPGTPPAIFCEDEHKGSLGKQLVGTMAFGLVGALRPTQLDTRYCLFDADDDSRLDHAVLLGAKGAGAAPFPISPARYALIEGLPLGPDAIARIRYVGPAGMSGSIAFDVEVFGNGMLRTLPHPRHVVPIVKLPAYAVIEGAVVTVLDYDTETRIATIRMDHDLAPGHIVIPELSRGY